MDESTVLYLRQKLRETSKYSEKWDVLKPTITHLFLDQEERKSIPEICQMFKAQLDFPAMYETGSVSLYES
jgi:hypothetical protein